MNVLLYRRKFAPYKYFVVALVTAGITMFMAFGEQKSSKVNKQQASAGPWSSVIGLLYLLINLAMDGVLNSTHDEIFARYKVTGQQMMLFMNVNSALLNTFLAILPLPYIPVLHPSQGRSSDLTDALRFLRAHPKAVYPLFQFAITGALGQLFIFETLQHFGSLTLV
jgi:UDP-galactose transporter B1